jgi:competence protein ComEC
LPWHWQWGRAQLVIFIGLLPVLIVWFAQVPLLSIPANLLAVPWVSLLTTPLVLLGCVLAPLSPALAEPLLQLGSWTLEVLWPLLVLFAEPRWNVLDVRPSGALAMLAGIAGAAILLLPRGVPGRWLGVFWLLPLLFPPAAAPAHGHLRFALLDVGQGLAAVVQTRRHALLYDTGPAFSEDFSAGAAVIVPYLRQAGIRTLDMIIVSHGDNDHSGGLTDVLDAIHARRQLASAPEQIATSHVETCRAGRRWRWDGVEFALLHPATDFAGGGNDRSCVLRVRNAQLSVLLPGDIEIAGEVSLVRHAAHELPAEVLVAPHHGSRTSSSAELIAAVGPRLVLFSTGFRNRYGFPKPDIIARYRQQGARPLDTARAGAIEIDTDADGYSLRTWRGAARRFWHSRP